MTDNFEQFCKTDRGSQLWWGSHCHSTMGSSAGRPGASTVASGLGDLEAAGAAVWADRPDGYPLGTYRMATAPESNSVWPTSFKSTYLESPSNNFGP